MLSIGRAWAQAAKPFSTSSRAAALAESRSGKVAVIRE
jgi:hypothetical protein